MKKNKPAYKLFLAILYWHGRNSKGDLKLRVEKNKKLWLAKHRWEWYEEFGITEKQYDKAIAVLKKKKLVETNIFYFDGRVTPHIRINEKVFPELGLPNFSINPEKLKWKLTPEEVKNCYNEFKPQKRKRRKIMGQKNDSAKIINLKKGENEMQKKGKCSKISQNLDNQGFGGKKGENALYYIHNIKNKEKNIVQSKSKTKTNIDGTGLYSPFPSTSYQINEIQVILKAITELTEAVTRLEKTITTGFTRIVYLLEVNGYMKNTDTVNDDGVSINRSRFYEMDSLPHPSHKIVNKKNNNENRVNENTEGDSYREVESKFESENDDFDKNDKNTGSPITIGGYLRKMIAKWKKEKQSVDLEKSEDDHILWYKCGFDNTPPKYIELLAPYVFACVFGVDINCLNGYNPAKMDYMVSLYLDGKINPKNPMKYLKALSPTSRNKESGVVKFLKSLARSGDVSVICSLFMVANLGSAEVNDIFKKWLNVTFFNGTENRSRFIQRLLQMRAHFRNLFARLKERGEEFFKVNFRNCGILLPLPA